MTDIAIWARGLTKRFGDTVALAGVDMFVPTGTILGVLGPNGAGKSTTVRILTTLTRPDGGTANVGGFDVESQASEVRSRIGVAAQDATVDAALTGRQNLVMIGELCRLPRRESRRRAGDLLERFDLVDAADRVVKTYSGGMRRRLDLAASLVNDPAILFLDEPTTGLDPTSRAGMWSVIRRLLDYGTTVLLTTQYLDEADQLADRISVIDHGRVIAEGTPAELKAATGGQWLVVRLSWPCAGAAQALWHLTGSPPQVSADGLHLTCPVPERPGVATAVVDALGAAGAAVEEVALHRPSLDDVFFTLTGRSAAQEQEVPV